MVTCGATRTQGLKLGLQKVPQLPQQCHSLSAVRPGGEGETVCQACNVLRVQTKSPTGEFLSDLKELRLAVRRPRSTSRNTSGCVSRRACPSIGHRCSSHLQGVRKRDQTRAHTGAPSKSVPYAIFLRAHRPHSPALRAECRRCPVDRALGSRRRSHPQQSCGQRSGANALGSLAVETGASWAHEAHTSLAQGCLPSNKKEGVLPYLLQRN